jgi:hypothetical protein
MAPGGQDGANGCEISADPPGQESLPRMVMG